MNSIFPSPQIKFLSTFLLTILVINNTWSQEIGDNSFNYNSIRPIRKADIMYQKTIWTRIDLKQKINEPYYANNLEIVRSIIDAVKAGVLRPYTSDSLINRMSIKQFNDNLKVPGLEDPAEDDFGAEDGGDDFGSEFDTGDEFGDDDFGDYGGDESTSFLPRQVYNIVIKYDAIYDKRRSRLYNDLQSVQLVVPADENPLGIDKEVAVFSFKELVENVFIDNPNAVWFNTSNDNAHLNLADAFDLSLQYGHIVKYSNPRDDYIQDVYTEPKDVLLKSLEYEYKIMDYESVTWEQ